MNKQVTFDAVSCCAAAHAFIRNPKLVSEWTARVSGLPMYYEILTLSRRLTFTANRVTASIYRSFAQVELSRIESNLFRSRLMCSHGPVAHRAALRKVLRDLPASD